MAARSGRSHGLCCSNKPVVTRSHFVPLALAAAAAALLAGCGSQEETRTPASSIEETLSIEETAAAVVAEEGSCASGTADGDCTTSTAKVAKEETGGTFRWQPKTLSVVLPCASEGQFVIKTVESVAASVPGGREVLKEIIVVDDGSRPPVDKSFSEEQRAKLGVRLIRHEAPKGLIQAKAAGGAAATGDVIVFFDCHVAPQPGWHARFLDAMAVNYRRIVVPSITDLDIDTWQQRHRHTALSNCYLTWDADFKWILSKDNYIPILSGGLLAISQRWWQETGGYDPEMKNWGGENIDQSLRTWLCGGEIVAVPEAEVAHMWRTEDKRTKANYRVDHIQSLRNRARAAVAWFGNFTQKLVHYPSMRYTKWWDMNVSGAFGEVQERLQCRSFPWFLWRFRDVYEHGGLLPDKTYRIQHRKSGLCLTYMGPAGTHPEGRDEVLLMECGEAPDRWGGSGPTDAQRWHESNQNMKTGKCCSGFRLWNTDQCLGFTGQQTVGTTVCEVNGRLDQLWRLTEENEALAPGQIVHPRGFCLSRLKDDTIKAGECKKRKESGSSKPVWIKTHEEVPLETDLYRKAMQEQPHLFAQG